MLGTAFRLGDWTVRPEASEIVDSTEVRRIEPRTMDVLVDLARHAGEVRTRIELIDDIWGGRFVGDEALTRCISELRKALDDDARNPRYIQTVPKRGYRLIARVVLEPAAGAESTSPTADARQADVLVLADRVDRYWIRPVLEANPFESTFLDLRLVEDPAAVAWPWDGPPPDRRPRRVAPDEPLHQTFDEAGHSLLILGPPGSGKTTLLVHLADHWRRRARTDATAPVPVILALSSWAGRPEPLEHWIVGELSVRYQIPREIGRRWLSDGRVVLLLDGLDEMAAASQGACVDAINTFRDRFGLLGMVVTSRDDAYRTGAPLALGTAVVVQAPNRAEVADFLPRAGPAGAAISSALESDPDLGTITASPLMLSVAAQACAADPRAAGDRGRRRLWDVYVDAMTGRRPMHARDRDRLRWLASAMRTRSETVFQTERLQPVWLSTLGRMIVHVVVSRLLISLTAGLATAAMAFVVRSDGRLALAIVGGAVAAGLAAAVGDVWRLIGDRRPGLRYAVVAAPVIAFVAIQPVVGVADREETAVVFAVFAQVGFVLFGLPARRPVATADVARTELLTWSTAQSVRGAALGVGIGLAIVILGWTLGLGTQASRVTIPFLVAVVGVLFGLRGRSVAAHPRAGLALFLRNSLFGGALVAAGIAATVGPIALAIDVGSDEVGEAAIVVAAVVIGGTMATLWFGGADAIKHVALRCQLAVHRSLPLRTRAFTGRAAAATILRRTGTGHTFVHRSLMDHLADEVAPPPAT